LYFSTSGSIHHLYVGTLIKPTLRLTEAAVAPPSLLALGLTLPHMLVLFGVRNKHLRPMFPLLLYSTIAVLVLSLALLGKHNAALGITWLTLMPLPTIIIIVGVARLAIQK